MIEVNSNPSPNGTASPPKSVVDPFNWLSRNFRAKARMLYYKVTKSNSEQVNLLRDFVVIYPGFRYSKRNPN
jgi:hypothetical protein